MPQPIPLPVRQHILALAQKGLDGAAIGRQLDLSPRTVQHLIRRFARGGPETCRPSYPAACPSAPADPLIQQGLFLRQAHPTWGAGFIRVRLQQLHPGAAVPSERTLQRWFGRGRQPPAAAGRKPPAERQAALGPHDVWQMDAVEELPLAGGQLVSWLRWVDEFSGAVLGTVVFPPGQLGPGAGRAGADATAAAVWPLGPAQRLAGR
jgi:hypothetical protein